MSATFYGDLRLGFSDIMSVDYFFKFVQGIIELSVILNQKLRFSKPETSGTILFLSIFPVSM